jgi:hypothetical protein
MPKPYKPIPDDRWAFGKDAIRARPVLAQHMAVIIQQSTHIHILLANALSLVLHVEAEPAMTMYAAISNDGARDAAFRAVGKSMLSQEKQSELNKILRKFSRYEKHRNIVAHGFWAAAEKSPEYLLYFDPAEYIRWKASVNVAGAKDDSRNFLELLAGERGLIHRATSYDEDDFIYIERLYDLMAQRVNAFSESLLKSSNTSKA